MNRDEIAAAMAPQVHSTAVLALILTKTLNPDVTEDEITSLQKQACPKGVAGIAYEFADALIAEGETDS